MRTWLLLLTYCGTRYAGWQVQPNLPTIEGEIEKALQQLTEPSIKYLAAVEPMLVFMPSIILPIFKVHKILQLKWQKALNGLLPPDIVVRNAVEKPISFHARHDSISKRF